MPQLMRNFETRKRRLKVAVIVAIALLGIGWWNGVFGIWHRYEAEKALRAHQLDRAESLAKQAIRLGPRSSDSMFLLARVQRKQGNLNEFQATLQQATALGVDAERIEVEQLLGQAQSGHIEPIQTRLNSLLIHGGGDDQDVLEAYVNGCLAAARLSQADTLIAGWKKGFPDEAQPLYYQARLQLFYGRSAEAKIALQEALERQPKHFAAAYLLGQILMQENQPEEALPKFELATGMVYNAAAQIEMARALRSLGRIDEARTLLENVVTLPEADARRSFHRVGDRFEGAPAKLALGNLELAADRHEQALKWLDATVKANPGDLSARHAKGLALRGLGKNEQATQELDAVRTARLALREVDSLADLIDKNPDLIDERVRIGELYLKYESKLTGEYWLKTALARDPMNAKAHELLGELYEEKATKDEQYQSLANYHKDQAQVSSQ